MFPFFTFIEKKCLAFTLKLASYRQKGKRNSSQLKYLRYFLFNELFMPSYNKCRKFDHDLR